MRRLLLIAVSVLLALPAISQDVRTNLIIKTDTGEQSVQFDELRRITFSGTTVQVEKFDGTAISNDMADIIYLSAKSETTNIVTPQNSGNLVDRGAFFLFFFGNVQQDALYKICHICCAVCAEVERLEISQ